ncbi:phage protein Gp37/Gp68 [Candidatus Magnetobacterium bavaricum]|uniref:Phage protein Gp37/Gp68 n=1 Tax=Candidatus Magnetobacterium bavaricum TaxID=29290 RepID=A0A0F3GVU0_9BACT|nr:phage protein Gp37/Gp68 [Candidatus Magnetobacterium bavaricum]
MAFSSKIEWTESTWNPVTGCSKVSDGCRNCYAERLARRLKAMNNPRYVHGFDVTIHDDLIEMPLKWKTPRIIFVNSMSDLFHEKIPISFIKRVFDVMAEADRHIFQILTKRSERMAEISLKLPWPENVWMGVTVESQRYSYRISDLEKVPAYVRFLSIEPMLSPILQLPLKNIDWVVVGGESGPECRTMKAEWAGSVRDQCNASHVPFFFKQWGGIRKNITGRLLDGKTWDEMPKTLPQTFSETHPHLITA